MYYSLGVFLLILMVYGFSAIPFSYLFSTLVGTAPGGFSLMTIIHTVTGTFELCNDGDFGIYSDF